MVDGRTACCDKNQVKKGPWSSVEEMKLISFIQKYGHDNWRALPKKSSKVKMFRRHLLWKIVVSV
ncbi:hypothetical protein Lal_00033961 [Lupinus albus]|nr:hypothetical protein Lal_00033961 [Lupinus albus]